MAFKEIIAAAEATGKALAMYQRQRGTLDYLPNYAGVFCYRPGVMQAWADAALADMDEDLCEILTVGRPIANRKKTRPLPR